MGRELGFPHVTAEQAEAWEDTTRLLEVAELEPGPADPDPSPEPPCPASWGTLATSQVLVVCPGNVTQWAGASYTKRLPPKQVQSLVRAHMGGNR